MTEARDCAMAASNGLRRRAAKNGVTDTVAADKAMQHTKLQDVDTAVRGADTELRGTDADTEGSW